MKRVNVAIAEPDRRRLIRTLFEEAAPYFEVGIDQLKHDHGASVDFHRPDARTFTCSVQLGDRQAECKVWLGNFLSAGETVLFAEGRTGMFGNSINDSIDVSVNSDPANPTYDALMGHMHATGKTEQMSLDESLQYL